MFVRDCPSANGDRPGDMEVSPQSDLPGFYPAVYPRGPMATRGLPLSDQPPAIEERAGTLDAHLSNVVAKPVPTAPTGSSDS